MSTNAEILQVMKQIALECGRFAYTKRRDGIEGILKPDGSLVGIDVEVEQMIKAATADVFGGCFHGEELGFIEATRNPHLKTRVDPLDGSTNFLSGATGEHYPSNPTWGVVIGLEQNNKSHIGVAYKPHTDELFWAVSGQGAFVQDFKFGGHTKQLKLGEIRSKRPLIGNGMIEGKTSGEVVSAIIAKFGEIIQPYSKGFSSRCMGASGIESLDVATGTLTAYISLVAEHDIAAARVILPEAGASISTFPAMGDKKGYFYMVASHPQIHEKLVYYACALLNPIAEITGSLNAAGNVLGITAGVNR